ncbi:MAG: response regulator transcription factor [Rubrivivax sp.]|nr:MAG: response regulator transcription factor [Rubrivivax sp.]
MSPNPDRHLGTVLVVDDAPDTLRMLCDALATEGYTVLVARDGAQALDRLELVVPDAILLDAVMPGLSGFETCQRIKAQPAWAHVPVIFMTGLSETADIVAGFGAGGVDYVVKPVRVEEVLVRLATHLRNARVTRLAREAVDVGGHGVLLLDARQRIAWRSPQAERWLRESFPDLGGEAPPAWLQQLAGIPTGHEVACPAPPPPLPSHEAGTQLVARSLGPAGLGETMVLLSVAPALPAGGVAADSAQARLMDDPTAQPSRVHVASLTPRETEVLSWLAKGKTNRDIADILGMSHRTVNKHLEHIFEKLGVETRAAAAALASRAIHG